MEEQTQIHTSFKPVRSVPVYEGALQLRVEPLQAEFKWSLRLYLEKGSVDRLQTIAYMTRIDQQTRVNIEIEFVPSIN